MTILSMDEIGIESAGVGLAGGHSFGLFETDFGADSSGETGLA